MTDVDDTLAKIAALREQGWEVVREEGPLRVTTEPSLTPNAYDVVATQEVRFRLRRIEGHGETDSGMVDP